MWSPIFPGSLLPYSATIPQFYTSSKDVQSVIARLCYYQQQINDYDNQQTDTINQLIDHVNSIDANIQQYIQDYIDEQIKEGGTIYNITVGTVQNWLDETMSGNTYNDLDNNSFIYREGR